jgi:hypothetical protein
VSGQEAGVVAWLGVGVGVGSGSGLGSGLGLGLGSSSSSSSRGVPADWGTKQEVLSGCSSKISSICFHYQYTYLCDSGSAGTAHVMPL